MGASQSYRLNSDGFDSADKIARLHAQRMSLIYPPVKSDVHNVRTAEK